MTYDASQTFPPLTRAEEMLIHLLENTRREEAGEPPAPTVFKFQDPHLFGSVDWTLPDWMQELAPQVSAAELAHWEEVSGVLAGIWLTLIAKAINGGENYKELLRVLRVLRDTLNETTDKFQTITGED